MWRLTIHRRKCSAHYKELEAIGLAAPQMTYIMHALKEHGMDVDVTATTVDRGTRYDSCGTGKSEEKREKRARVC